VRDGYELDSQEERLQVAQSGDWDEMSLGVKARIQYHPR